MSRAGGSAPFVGRQRELALLEHRLAALLDGQGGAVLVSGEPGIGKTRLLRECAGSARAAGAAVLWGACVEGDGAPPFDPWVEALGGYVRSIDPEWLRGELGPGAHLLAGIVPDLAAAVPPGLPPPPLAAQTQPLLHDAVTRLLQTAAEQQPLVLILDDLHWADGDSLALLGQIARLTSRVRLLILAGYRGEDVERGQPAGAALARLRRDADCLSLPLRGLSAHDVGVYLTEASGQSLPEALAERIAAETGGNAFYLHELALHLVESGPPSVGGDGGWSGAPIGVPSSVREMLGQRLARLSPAALAMLRHASGFSDGIPFALLQAVTDLSEDELLDGIDQALAAGLLVAAADGQEIYSFAHEIVRRTLAGEISPSRRLRLHRRIGEAIERVYAPNLTPWLGELARHFSLAAPSGDPTPAVVYARRAGEHARSLLAHAEAARLFESALASLDLAPTPDQVERCELLLLLGDALNRAGRVEEAKPAFARAGAFARDLRAAGGDYRVSLLLARAALGYGGISEEMFTNDTVRLALLDDALVAVGGGDSPLRARLLARLARVGYWRRGAETSEALSSEALAIARRTGDPAALAAALVARQYVLGDGGPVEARQALNAEMSRLAALCDDVDLAMTASHWRLASLLEAGDVAAADAEFEAFAARAEQLQQPYFRWCAAVYRATRALLSGRFDEAERLSGEALALGEPVEPWEAPAVHTGQTFLLRWEQNRLGELEEPYRLLFHHYPELLAVRCGLALILAVTGRGEECRTHYETLAVDGFAALKRGQYWLLNASALAILCAELNDAGGAASLYTLLLPADGLVALNGLGRACQGAVAHYLGLLAATVCADRDRERELPHGISWDVAARHFEDAIRLHDRIGADPWAAHSRAALAAALLARLRQEGDGISPDHRAAILARARALLEGARTVAAELGMTRLQERIAALDDQDAARRRRASPAGSSRIPHPASLPDGLTRREAEVLRLIAAGQTNREIADALGMSVLTVQRHIANAYAKIDARGRADAVAYAVRHGLSES